MSQSLMTGGCECFYIDITQAYQGGVKNEICGHLAVLLWRVIMHMLVNFGCV